MKICILNLTNPKKKIINNIILIFIILFCMLIATIQYNFNMHKAKMVMGGKCYSQVTVLKQNNKQNNKPSRTTKLQKYFRPSKLPVLNNRTLKLDLFNYQNEEPNNIELPYEILKTPQDTIINYFSILQQAENLKENQFGGCGTIGNAKLPYPIAYAFLTSEYKKKVTYEQFLKSFEGIAHISLIKLYKLPKDEIYKNAEKYFIEIETIEGTSKQVSYFAYYYGYIYIIKEGNEYKILDTKFYGEDFLCAPYHGWSHDAESYVGIEYGDWCSLIKERYPTQQIGYIKKIYFKGTDGNDYLIKFIQLTNGTDIEIAQYKKDKEGVWKLINFDPSSCLDKKKKTENN